MNDASLHYEPEVSDALGFGFRCGFLGMLHMEIIQEPGARIRPGLITTALRWCTKSNKDGEVVRVDNPSRLPDAGIEEMREPIVQANILVPQDYLGNVIQLCVEKRGVQKDMRFMGNQVQITWELPMAEVVMDFFDRLKSVSRFVAGLSLLRFEPASWFDSMS